MIITKTDLEKLQPEDYPLMKQIIEKTKQVFQELLDILIPTNTQRRGPSLQTYLNL